jgi:RimJ/RimL family protein N-acetyltransferase
VTVVFETERLRAREWTLDDAEEAYAIYRDPDVMRYLGTDPQVPADVAEQRERVARWIATTESYRDSGFGNWALVEKDTGAVVGMSLLKPLPEHEEVEVGWHLGKAYWGRGYATEGARAAIEHGFSRCGLDVIYAVVVPENTASIRVAERLGMTPRGRTDEYYGRELALFSVQRPARP